MSIQRLQLTNYRNFQRPALSAAEAARMSQAAAGHFLSADTIVPEPGNTQSLNRYSGACPERPDASGQSKGPQQPAPLQRPDGTWPRRPGRLLEVRRLYALQRRVAGCLHCAWSADGAPAAGGCAAPGAFYPMPLLGTTSCTHPRVYWTGSVRVSLMHGGRR